VFRTVSLILLLRQRFAEVWTWGCCRPGGRR
jgi:hypothetical protein